MIKKWLLEYFTFLKSCQTNSCSSFLWNCTNIKENIWKNMRKTGRKLEENCRKTDGKLEENWWKIGGKQEEIHMQRRLALLLTGNFLSKGAESVELQPEWRGQRIRQDPAAGYPWAARYSKGGGIQINHFKSKKQ